MHTRLLFASNRREARHLHRVRTQVKIGLNGFGRLGRLICRAIAEVDGIDIVAINDPYIDAEYMAYMLEHSDCEFGPYLSLIHI